MSSDYLTCRHAPGFPRAAAIAMYLLFIVSAAAHLVAGSLFISPSGSDQLTSPTAPPALVPPAPPQPSPTSSPLNLLKTAPRVQFERDGDPVVVTPAPTPPDTLEETENLPDSAMPLEPRRAIAPIAPDEAEQTGDPSQPRRRPGVVRSLLRSVPLLGPVIVRDKPERQRHRPGDRLADRDVPVHQPDLTDPADRVPLPAERPILFPPPPSRADMADETSTATPYDNSGVISPKDPAPEDTLPAPEPVSAPDPGPPTATAAPTSPSASQSTPVPTAMPGAASLAPQFDKNDLALPNPAAEENEALREEYTAALIRAREGDHAGAAALFRGYAAAHMLSRLTPRALFLAAIMDPDPARAAESLALLEKDFPASPYVTELRNRVAAGRVPALAAPAVVATATPPPAPPPTDGGTPGAGAVTAPLASPAETDTEAVARLERFLASTPVGPQTLRQRLDLCRLYLKMKQPQRAAPLLRTLLADARGRAEEPEALDLLAEYDIAEGRMDEAAQRLDAIIASFASYPALAKVRLNMGLVSEAAGNYQRALAEYRAVVAGWPGTPEAALARERIRDVEALDQ